MWQLLSKEAALMEIAGRLAGWLAESQKLKSYKD